MPSPLPASAYRRLVQVPARTWLVVPAALLTLLSCGPPATSTAPEAVAFDADAAAHRWLETSPAERASRLEALTPDELERLSVALRDLGQSHQGDPTPERAARAFEAASQIAERAGATVEVGLADFYLGRLYGRRGRYRDALGPLRSSVRHLRDAGDAGQLGAALNGLGIVLRNLGHSDQAVPIYREALGLADADTPARSFAARLHNLGTAYWEMGDLDLALETLSEALERKRQIDDGARLCSTLTSLANVRSDLGDDAQAEAMLRACLSGPEPPSARLPAMHNLAKLLRQRGEVDDAAELLETGHAAAVAGGHLAQALSLTQALATLELQREKPARALALMDEVLAAKGKASTSDDARSWVFIHMTRSHALRKVGRVDESLASAELTLRLAEEIGIPDATWQAWHDLGRARYGVGQVDGAAEALTAAIEVIEDWRRGVARADRRSGFLDRKLPPFHRLLELELERGRTDAALRVAERTRARALADALAVAAPEPSADAEASPLELPGEAAVVAFTVTGGQLWIWSRPAPGEGPAASGGPPIEEAGRWTSVPIPEAELVTRVEDVRRALADRSLGFKAPAAELGQLLFGPIARELAGARRLLLVPDGPLWDLPFSALELDGAPLVNRFTLYSVPSLRVLAALRRRPAAGRGDPLVLAGADGSGLVAQQAGAVAEVLGVKVLAGPDATTEALQEHLGSGPRLLHIAAHGIADALYPARSHLQLEPAGRGGRLEAAGLAALDLRSVDLALLAACESGRGGVRRGEGMLGLTWATLSAGARNALISHWRVDAAATSDLMVALHRRLAAGERDVARALQDSQLELAGEPATAHPFYWAGFSLVGSGQLSAASLPAGGLDRSP